MSKINSSLRKLSGDPKTTSSVTEPVQIGLYTWYDAFKGRFSGFNPRGIDAHFPHCILVKQVRAAAAVHKDSSEVKSVNNWV